MLGACKKQTCYTCIRHNTCFSCSGLNNYAFCEQEMPGGLPALLETYQGYSDILHLRCEFFSRDSTEEICGELDDAQNQVIDLGKRGYDCTIK